MVVSPGCLERGPSSTPSHHPCEGRPPAFHASRATRASHSAVASAACWEGRPGPVTPSTIPCVWLTSPPRNSYRTSWPAELHQKHRMERMRGQALQSIAPAKISRDEALAKSLLALNNAHAQELSWLEPARLEHLVAQAVLARRIGNLDAFLLAFDQGADYDSPNFLWFLARYPRFVYVDRVVVATGMRGRGYARQLFHGLFTHASAAGHARVVCEVNSDPPNPPSDAFHAALGFLPVGTAT